MMNFSQLINQRESCRNFSGKAVSKADLEKIIAQARLAPSAMNSQPWFFYVVVDNEKRQEVAKSVQKFNEKAGAFIVIIEEKPSIPVKVINNFKVQDYTKVDIGIVASYICLAATELGLGTCMLGLFHEEPIKKALNIPKEKRIRLLISVGYSVDKEPRPKTRKKDTEIMKII